MENQHRAISGYRELTQTEIDLMNKIKALGPQIEAVCDEIKAHINAQREACLDADGENGPVVVAPEEQARLDRAEPERWLQWGRDAMQNNLTMLTRAVAQPTFF